MTELGIFAKYWQAGAVKTRLAKSIGRQQASMLYRVFLETLLHRFAELADRRILAFTPGERRDAFARLAADRWMLEPQTLGDLGSRMQQFFDSAFSRGADRVVLLGSDSPTLPTAYVQQGFDQLEHASVVLGPAADGGYYLVGASRETPPVFRGVDWSSARVWEQTIRQLESAGWSYHILPDWYDVDSAEDLLRLRDELTRDTNRAAAESRLLAAIRTMVAD